MGRYLLVTWDGGGNVHPALGIARLLAARGHSVRVMGQRTLRQRVGAAGCVFRSFPDFLEWDASRGRSWEDEGQREYSRALVVGPIPAKTVLAEINREPADVLVVDAFLRSVLCAAEYSRLPTAALLHVRYRFRMEVQDQPVWRRELELVNETRQRLTLQPIPWEEQPPSFTLWRRCDRVLVVLPREFEDFAGPLPPNVLYVGPVLEGDEAGAVWDLPWPRDHPDPLVVVAFSTTYMYHEEVVGRVLPALASLPVRVLLTLGGGLEPHEVAPPPGVVVRQYVPHAMVLPHTSLLVTHAGMGSVMAAFAFGVPILCLPFGRDQNGNAARVEVLGAGRTIARDASVEKIRAAVLDVLGSETLRAGARRMAEIVAGYVRGRQAIGELESFLATRRRS